MNNAIDSDQDFCIIPNKTINEKLLNLLKSNDKYVNNNGQILRLNVIDDANNEEEKLLGLLLSDDKIKETFFKKVSDIYIFRKKDFIDTINSYNFMPNSYTKFCERIGLVDRTGSFLVDSNDVVLQFPHKDCYLEGGQTKEDQKYTEIFYNEVLARDEVDRLLAPKVFSNVTKYSKEGLGDLFPLKDEHPTTFDIEKDNLLIKGNNLVALSSILKRYEGKVKCIYIDPPYNTGGDSFKYNDNFNHSTWLTFMKNRFELAKKLLRKDGCIFVQCDHHELGYLHVLLDEIFGVKNKAQIITIKTSAPSGFKAVNPGPIDVSEYILFYTKDKDEFDFKLSYTEASYNKNYNLFLSRDNKNPDDTSAWKFIPIKEQVLISNGFSNENEAKELFKGFYKDVIESMIADFAYKNAENIVSIRDLHNPTEEMKRLQNLSKDNRSEIYEYTGQTGKKTYFYNGGPLAFYSNKMQELNGKTTVTELLTNFWQHISWAGIAKEGGVKLKNGKKPEKLLKEIINMTTNENDIVLDYHLGCGTTAAVAHKLHRRYIGIEQLNYCENDSSIRLKNVLIGDNTGISKDNDVNGQGHGSFIYCELAEDKNAKYLKKIDSASEETINDIRDEIIENAIIRYEADKNTEALKSKDWSFTYNEGKTKKEYKLETLEDKKNALKQLIDKNYMYINYSEMDDSKYSYLSETDKAFTKSFYEGV